MTLLISRQLYFNLYLVLLRLNGTQILRLATRSKLNWRKFDSCKDLLTTSDLETRERAARRLTRIIDG